MGYARQDQHEFDREPKGAIIDAQRQATIGSEKQQTIDLKNKQQYQPRPIDANIVDIQKTVIIDSAERDTKPPLIARTEQGSKDQTTSFDKDRR